MNIEPRPKNKPQKDTYFYMWNLTEAGVASIDDVSDALEKASNMLRSLGGKCNLYASLGGQYELIGVATEIDDDSALRILRVVDSLGYFRTTSFIKAKDYHLDEFKNLAADVVQLKTKF